MKTPPFENKTERHPFLSAAILALLTILVYIPLRHAGFVWDDSFSIQNNPLLRSRAGLWEIWTTIGHINKEAHYWPLAYTTLWLDFHLWGASPLGYHIVNLLWHVANTLLVWRLLTRIGMRSNDSLSPASSSLPPAPCPLSPAIAWLAALLFGIHPVHVESVAWVVERKDVLSGFFYLSAFILFIRREQSGGIVNTLLALGCFVLALLSKSVAVTFPLALLVYFWWRDGRLAAPHFRRVAPFLALAVLLGAADSWVVAQNTDYIYPLDPAQRVLLASRSFWIYARQNIWPELRILYPRWSIDPNNPLQYLPLLAILALLIGLWRLRARIGRGPLALTLFYGLTLGPTLGLVGFEFLEQSFVADRFQYLASIAPLTLLATAFIGLGVPASAGIPPKGGTPKLSAIRNLIFCVFAIFLGALTWRQTTYFQDDTTLFGRALEKNPPTAFICGNLGVGYLQRHDWRQAENYMRQSIALRPDYGINYNNLAYALVQQGRVVDAIPVVRLAIQYRPRQGGDRSPWPEAMASLAWYLATYPDKAVRNPDEAIQLAGQALSFAGPNPHFLDVLAAADAAAGHFDEAIQIAQEAADQARAAGVIPMANEIQSRAELYKKKQPYTDQSLAPHR